MTGSPRVLAFRHVPFESLGLIADSLEEHGIASEYVDLFARSDLEPRIEDAAGLVFMGGPMSVNDDLAYIRTELRLIERAVSLGMPILGVCLGSQLIARALGSRVYKNGVKEIGWAPVYFTEAAAGDPLLSGLNNPETIFHWHGETFDLPRGAELLAISGACRHQAFRVGDRIHGFQFHLEVTPQMISSWCAEDANEGDMRELDHSIDPHQNSSRLRELSALVFGRWCNLVKSAACCAR
ncbi:MAG: type 1 glutamine amidotransferase [Bryobacteraceae bacterium]